MVVGAFHSVEGDQREGDAQCRQCAHDTPRCRGGRWTPARPWGGCTQPTRCHKNITYCHVCFTCRLAKSATVCCSRGEQRCVPPSCRPCEADARHGTLYDESAHQSRRSARPVTRPTGLFLACSPLLACGLACTPDRAGQPQSPEPLDLTIENIFGARGGAGSSEISPERAVRGGVGHGPRRAGDLSSADGHRRGRKRLAGADESPDHRRVLGRRRLAVVVPGQRPDRVP